MDIYRTEEEQLAALRRWWARSGAPTIVGVVLGVAGIFGWQWWGKHQHTQSMEAHTLYVDMLATSSQDQEAVSAQADVLLGQYSVTAYAIFAAMQLAARAAQQGDLAQASEKLLWVLRNASREQFLSIARLRLARIYIAQGQLDEAEQLLSIGDTGGFHPVYTELLGDIYSLRGDIQAAREAWQTALQNYASGNEQLSAKLQDAGG